MKRMISACLRFEAPDLWLAVPAALFPVLVVEVTALMIAATEDDPEALVLLPGVGMILTVVLCCVLGVVYLCSNFPLLLQFSASRRGSLAGLCLHILRMTVLAEVIAAAAIMALGAVNHGFFPRFAVGELWRGIPVLCGRSAPCCRCWWGSCGQAYSPGLAAPAAGCYTFCLLAGVSAQTNGCTCWQSSRGWWCFPWACWQHWPCAGQSG